MWIPCSVQHVLDQRLDVPRQDEWLIHIVDAASDHIQVDEGGEAALQLLANERFVQSEFHLAQLASTSSTCVGFAPVQQEIASSRSYRRSWPGPRVHARSPGPSCRWPLDAA